jgi:hypothetical protein
MTGYVVVRLPVAAAEALADDEEGVAEGWPDDWPDHAQAFSVALAAVECALNDPEPEQHCGCCLGHRRGQLDAEEHHRVLTASRAPGVEFVAIGATLHGLDCHVARAHSPLAVEPGGWRSKIPMYLTAAEAKAWLLGRGHRACKRCITGV